MNDLCSPRFREEAASQISWMSRTQDIRSKVYEWNFFILFKLRSDQKPTDKEISSKSLGVGVAGLTFLAWDQLWQNTKNFRRKLFWSICYKWFVKAIPENLKLSDKL